MFDISQKRSRSKQRFSAASNYTQILISICFIGSVEFIDNDWLGMFTQHRRSRYSHASRHRWYSGTTWQQQKWKFISHFHFITFGAMAEVLYLFKSKLYFSFSLCKFEFALTRKIHNDRRKQQIFPHCTQMIFVCDLSTLFVTVRVSERESGEKSFNIFIYISKILSRRVNFQKKERKR